MEENMDNEMEIGIIGLSGSNTCKGTVKPYVGTPSGPKELLFI